MIELREYQKNILDTCLDDNTLVILPTGTGKTIIAFFLILERLKQYPDQKIFFLAPTRPLVNQHYNNFIKLFPDKKEEAILILGDMPKERRGYLYKQGKIIFITPQTLQNDIINGIITFYNSSTIIFDEAHRAVKKYSYVFIAKKFMEQSKNPRILALTASPGWNLDRIREVINNLYIKNIEIRTGKEDDIKNYIKDIEIQPIEVELDKDVKEILNLLNKAEEIRMNQLKGIFDYIDIKKGKKDILYYIDDLKKKIQFSNDSNIKYGLLLLSELLKIEHAKELIQTQTVESYVKYIKKIEENIKKSRSDKLFLSDIRIKKTLEIASNILRNNKEHPKLLKLLEILNKNKDKKIIVFAQIKDTLEIIKKYLDKYNFKSKLFAGKKYMKQSDQKKVLGEFREGYFNILLATSVGEEGIDIPKVDLVIFYEPVPSEIRSIQRRGRTGRGEFGEVYILYTKGTIDERFYWVSIRKEKKMFLLIKRLYKYLDVNVNNTLKNNKKFDSNYYNMNNIKDIINKEINNQNNNNQNSNLNKNSENNIIKYMNNNLNNNQNNNKEDNKKEFVTKIIVDYKEKDSGVVQILYDSGILIEMQNLNIGDYIIGDYIIERKTLADFVQSLADGRLFNQLNNMKSISDKKSILILEGEDFEILDSNISENYLRTIILKIVLEYEIPIIRTKDFIETAKYLYLLSKNSHIQTKIPEFFKNYKSLDDIKLKILKDIPGIGDQLALKLLDRFKSLKNIFLANKVELSNIVGEAKAERIKKIFEEEYKGGS